MCQEDQNESKQNFFLIIRVSAGAAVAEGHKN